MNSNDEIAIIDGLCDQFEQGLQDGDAPSIADLLTKVSVELRPKLLRELLALEQELLPEEQRLRRNEDHQENLVEFADIIEEVSAELRTRLGNTTDESTNFIRQIGPYKILQSIGEGGMGSVYMAEQEKPVKRRVALKIIKAGLDSKQIIARFEAERQALAMMDHPSIARILDAGTTETGQPFFAMELVKGIPLTEYCDRHKLSIPDRLQIFEQICEGVQHAHQKGIIHRDLKPANILVAEYNGKPIPKIIDFGLAKALEVTNKLTDKTMFTEFGQVMGTLKYMSPEQAGLDSLDIDTRSDIYTLGIILYELLTGSTPLDGDSFKGQALLKILELVREQESPRPSSKLTTSKQTLSTVTELRQIDPRKLTQILSGDLDWIVMKAIEKDRNRRYLSAGAFGEDIQRYLSDEVVEARPPSRSYKVQKFVKKNRGLVVATSLIFLMTVAGIVGTSAAAMWAFKESKTSDRLAKEAVLRAEELTLVSDFQASQLSDIDIQLMGTQLYASLLGKVGLQDRDRLKAALSPINFSSIAKSTLEKNIFEKTLAAIDKDFENQPLLQSRLLQTTADSMAHLGLLQQALEPQRQALEIRRSQLGLGDPLTLESTEMLGLLLIARSEFTEAEKLLTQVHESRLQNLGPDHPETWKSENNIGTLMLESQRFAEAESHYRNVLDKTLESYGQLHLHTATANSNVALALAKQQKPNEARKYGQLALETRIELLGEKAPLTLTSLTNMGTLLMRQGNFTEAEPMLKKSTEISKVVLGDTHPDTLLSLNNFGACLTRTTKFDLAESVLLETLSGRQKVLGGYHPHTASTLENLGYLFFQKNDAENARKYMFQSVDSLRTSLKKTHPLTQNTTNSLVGMLEQTKDYQSIIVLLTPYESLNSSETALIRPQAVAGFLTQLGMAKLRLNEPKNFPSAVLNLETSYRIFAEAGGTESASAKNCQQLLVELYQSWAKADPGEGHNVKARQWQERQSQDEQN